MRVLLLTIALLLLMGCSTMGLPGKNSWSYNPANYQGTTVVEYEKDGTTIRWIDAKDKATISLSGDLNSDGNVDVTYDASDVVGSDAAAIRAEVEKVFSDNGAQVTPDIVQGIVDAILGL